MKKIFLIFLISLSLIANESDKKKDLMNVKIKEDLILKNGYGTVSAKPILNDKALEEKIILRGDFNVDKTNNAKFEFDKVEYKGKIYNLNNAFIKKGRLKSADVTLKKDTNLTVTGGNQKELLDIINAVSKDEQKNTSKNEIKSKSNVGVGSGQGGYRNNNTGFDPRYLDNNNSSNNNNGSSNNNSSSNDNNSAIVVTCPEPSWDGTLATYYIQLGTICTKRTTTSVEKLYNTKSCKNKIDYNTKQVILGYETFANDPEGGTFLVQRCEYEEPIKMTASTDSCKGLPDYKNKTVQIQKQYSYVWENKTNKVGQCTPVEEFVPLEYDINVCPTERHDFEKNVSIEQGNYFYNYENKKTKIGECVDIPEYTYNQYFDSTTCKYQIVDGRVLYKQRVAYNDLNGIQNFATDCQVTNSGGLEILEEFAGYKYNDSSKQALRKINQYFIIPDTTTKEYIQRDVVTDTAYPYVEETCSFTHDDEKKQSTLTTKIYFRDTTENVIVEVNPCQVKQIIPYTLVNGGNTVTFNRSLGFNRLDRKTDGTYHFFGNESKVIDITTGLFPTLKGGSEDITKYYNGSCQDNIGNPTFVFKDVPNPQTLAKTCVGGTETKANSILNIYFSTPSGDLTYCLPSTKNFVKTTCNYYQYWEEIGEYTNQASYIRGDGTTYKDKSSLLYRIMK